MSELAEEMQRRADAFVEVAAQHGYALDYAPASLEAVETIIDTLFADAKPWRRGKPAKRYVGTMGPVVGAYLGEVVVRDRGGEWRVLDARLGAGVLLPDGTWTSVEAKGIGRFENGKEDDLVFYFAALEAISGGSSR